MTMTRAERDDLLKLMRQRERVAKAAAKQRSAELIMDFEQKIAAEFKFDQREVWKRAAAMVQKVVADANAMIIEECKKLGIPPQFGPSISAGWYGRGENASEQRRAELRRVAVKRIEAMEAQAIADITKQSVEAQTALLAHGLGGAAQEFLASLPSAEKMMPAIPLAEVAKVLTDKRSHYDGAIEGGYPDIDDDDHGAVH